VREERGCEREERVREGGEGVRGGRGCERGERGGDGMTPSVPVSTWTHGMGGGPQRRHQVPECTP
jgi:hypothetical protein